MAQMGTFCLQELCSNIVSPEGKAEVLQLLASLCSCLCLLMFWASAATLLLDVSVTSVLRPGSVAKNMQEELFEGLRLC